MDGWDEMIIVSEDRRNRQVPEKRGMYELIET